MFISDMKFIRSIVKTPASWQPNHHHYLHGSVNVKWHLQSSFSSFQRILHFFSSHFFFFSKANDNEDEQRMNRERNCLMFIYFNETALLARNSSTLQSGEVKRFSWSAAFFSRVFLVGLINDHWKAGGHGRKN